MSTIINIGDMIALDRFNKTPFGSPESRRPDGTLAGEAFISFSAATQNSLNTKIRTATNDNIILQLRNDPNRVTTDDANSTDYFEIQSKTEYSPDDQVYVTKTNYQGTKIYYQIDK